MLVRSYEGSREPDISGALGKGWKYNAEDTQTCLRAWLIHRPDAHRFWHNYMLSVVHLRPVEGLPDPWKTSPAMTHEVMVIALNPEVAPDPDDSSSIEMLQPLNLSYQIESFTDDAAIRLCDQFAEMLASGAVNPDTDFRNDQIAWLDAAVDRFRTMN